MAETEYIRKRGLAQISKDVYYGTTTITITGAAVTADSATITLDPAYSATPVVVYGYSVARTGSAGATSVEIKTNSSTELAFTGKVSTAPGGADTTIITVKYLVFGDAYAT
jgi:hypothetical protein